MILKLVMKHQEKKLYTVYINHVLGMTMAFLMARAEDLCLWNKMSSGGCVPPPHRLCTCI